MEGRFQVRQGNRLSGTNANRAEWTLNIKYPRTPYWPWSPTIGRDDSVHLDPDRFVGEPVVVTEKLDGGNTLLHAGKVYARSVAAPSAEALLGPVDIAGITELSPLLASHVARDGDELAGAVSVTWRGRREVSRADREDSRPSPCSPVARRVRMRHNPYFVEEDPIPW